ncbi:MAG: sensor histidine kinase KdpD, partial [Deltaproteobacteria bacterium]|nr:sensor histidine kinase KdpD [Deltaproteobacteria bacterium]
MAAGAGKTYTMLTDALVEKRRGVDVVAGYIEPHGRLETEQLATHLEHIPFRHVRHKGVQTREFDLDAAILRHPKILLVDELAHSNAEGAR